MTPIVEGDLAQTGGAEGAHRRQKLRLRLKIGKGWAKNAAQRSSASQPALDVVEVRLDPRGARFVEAGFDNPSRFGERLEIASLVPGAGGRAGDRGDDRDRRAWPHGLANLADQRRDDVAAQREERREFSIGARIGEKERLGHVGGKIDVACEIGPDVGGDLPAQRLDPDPGFFGAGRTMFAKAETELRIEPSIGAMKRELVMISVRVRQKPWRLQRDAGDRVGFGDVERKPDRVGARIRRRRAEAIHVTVAEGVGDGRLGMKRAKTRIVEEHKPHVGRELALLAEFPQDIPAGGDHGMGHGFDRAVALQIGRKVDNAILRKIDFSRPSMRAQELAGMIAPGDRHSVETERSEALERR